MRSLALPGHWLDNHINPDNHLPGLLLCGVLTCAAWPLGAAFPLVGAPVAGLLLGLVVGNCLSLPAHFERGIHFSVNQLLKWAIIGLGLQLSIQQLWSVGSQSLQVTAVTLSLAFASAWLLGRWLKLPKRKTLLIGAGTAICGGSAIAAIAPIVRADKKDMTLALTTIFLFNLVAVIVFPLLGHWMGLSDTGFGVWAGTAINDTSSVVAAAYSYSQHAGDIATIVKLTRASLILPVCLLLSLVMTLRNKGTAGGVRQSVPWFILGFVLASALHSLGVLPAGLEADLETLAHAMLVMALVAVGLGSQLGQLWSAGRKPLLLGLIVSVLVASSSLGVQWLQAGL